MKKLLYTFLLITGFTLSANFAFSDNTGINANLIVTLYRPVVGEHWSKGVEYPVTWFSNIAGNVDIQLYASDKTTLIVTIATDSPNDGTENWTVPADPATAPAGNYYVKVSSHDDPTIFGWSGQFGIIAENPNLIITVYRPVVNEDWIKGTTYPIVWWSNVSGTVDIELYQSDKSTLVAPIVMNTANDGTEAWAIPSDALTVPEAYYYVKISSHSNPTVFVWSDRFHVLANDPNKVVTIYRPSLGEKWIKGNTYPIVWWSDVTGNVEIKVYESDKTTLAATVAASTPNDGTQDWTIPAGVSVPVGDYYVKVTSIDNPAIYVWSGVLHVIGSDPSSIITVYRPSVGEEWVKGSSYPITWYDNITENVDIKLYQTDKTTLVTTIASDVAGLTSTWTIGNSVPAGNYYIKISGHATPGIYVWSGLFKVISTDPNMLFTVYSPSVGEDWIEGTTHNITWWDNVTENVKIELFTEGGVYVRPIVVSAPSNGTYAWTVPMHTDLAPFPVPGNYKLNFSRLMTNAIQTGGDRLVATQNVDNGWGWYLGDPSAQNIIGPIGKSLVQSYNRTLSAAQLASINRAKTFLLAKVGNFSPSDGYLAKALDDLLGGTTCVTYVNAHYYGLLAAGTYERSSAPGVFLNTAAYLSLIQTSRHGAGIGNMAAWDLGIGLVGASSCGVSGAELDLWINATKAEVNTLTSGDYYDVLGLAGSLYGLSFVGATFDPTSGSFASAASISDLANTLATFQIDNGGFTWNATMVSASNETVQETAYAILALNQVNRTTYSSRILGAADYLASAQLPTGGWENYSGDGENNQITGEALWAYTVAYAAGTYPSISRWSGVFRIVLDGKKSVAGYNQDLNENGLSIYPNPANDRLNVESVNIINHVTVMNNLGKTVLEAKPNTTSASFEVSSLSTGLYLVKVESNGTTSINKVMIK